jgi:hypothetical protein
MSFRRAFLLSSVLLTTAAAAFPVAAQPVTAPADSAATPHRPWFIAGGIARTGLTHPNWDSRPGPQVTLRLTALRQGWIEGGPFLAGTFERLEVRPIAPDPFADPPQVGRRAQTLETRAYEIGLWASFQMVDIRRVEVLFVPHFSVLASGSCTSERAEFGAFPSEPGSCWRVAGNDIMAGTGLEAVYAGRAKIGASGALGFDQFFRPPVSGKYASRTRMGFYMGYTF